MGVQVMGVVLLYLNSPQWTPPVNGLHGKQLLKDHYQSETGVIINISL